MTATNTLSVRPKTALATPYDPIPAIAQRRILYVDHTAKLGGGEIALINLVTHLGPTCHPIVVLFSDGPLVARMLGAGIETHVLPLDHSVVDTRKDSLGMGSLFRIRAVVRICLFILELRRFIRKHEIELVHTNSLKSDVIGGIAGRLAHVPVVWHLRDRIADDYLPPAAGHVFRWLARVIPQRVIANSLATLGTLRLKSYRNAHAVPSGLAIAPRFHVVHDGMHRTNLVAEVIEDSNPTLTVGLIGRITRWKGQHIFLEAASIVRRQFPQARFQIIGAPLFDETDYENELRQLATLHNLDDVVEFTGHRDDVPSLIAQMDLLVHASTTGEPFGQVIIEGMAAGKPVVATNGGGVPEIVIHGVTGLLVPMGDADAMAQAIIRFLGNPAFRASAGRLGRQRVHDYFTIDRTAQKVQSVYDGLFESIKPSDKMAEVAEENPAAL
jgi:glycosyltransferase involved in cell wall biosynthesis